MDLSKDSRNVYTIDSKSYAMYMEDNWEQSSDLLSRLIKILLLILVIVLGYFFYKILKNDISLNEVFNTQALIIRYELFQDNDKVEEVKEQDYLEALAVPISTEVKEVKKSAVLAISKQYDESLVKKEASTVKKNNLKPIVKRVETPKTLKKEVIIQKEIFEENVLSDAYLKRMAEEMENF